MELAKLALAEVQLACKLAYAACRVLYGAVRCRKRARTREGTHAGTWARGSAGSRMQLATAAAFESLRKAMLNMLPLQTMW